MLGVPTISGKKIAYCERLNVLLGDGKEASLLHRQEREISLCLLVGWFETDIEHAGGGLCRASFIN